MLVELAVIVSALFFVVVVAHLLWRLLTWLGVTEPY